MHLNDFKKRKEPNFDSKNNNNINQTITKNNNYFDEEFSKEKSKAYLNFFPTNIYSKKNKRSFNNKFNSTFPNLYTNTFNQHSKEDYLESSNTSLIENELKNLKLDYITLKNDNIIFREDINKLLKLNKQLELNLEEERSHNYELAKENDILNNKNRNLYRKIEEVNQKIYQMKTKFMNEEGLINKQRYLEGKINEKDQNCQMILEDNNKLNMEYNLLKDQFIRLQEKNRNEEKELNELKLIHEEKLNDIESKMEILIQEINKLKYENNELKKQNDYFRNIIMNKEKKKDEYYNKYKELKIKNEMISKENEDIQKKYAENKILLQRKEQKSLIKERMRRNNTEHKIRVIQDLQKKIQRYKNARIQKLSNQEDE